MWFFTDKYKVKTIVYTLYGRFTNIEIFLKCNKNTKEKKHILILEHDCNSII